MHQTSSCSALETPRSETQRSSLRPNFDEGQEILDRRWICRWGIKRFFVWENDLESLDRSRREERGAGRDLGFLEKEKDKKKY